MHISLDDFVAGPHGEMNRIKVDEEIFDHVGKRSVHCPPLPDQKLMKPRRDAFGKIFDHVGKQYLNYIVDR